MDQPTDPSKIIKQADGDVCPAATRWLPRYLCFLRNVEAVDQQCVSAERIAAALNIEPDRVRQDIAVLGVTARAGVGFVVVELMNAIERYLGWDNITDALLVGAGRLGAALAGYTGFAQYGMNIAAVFDIDDHKVGQTLSGKKVHHFDRIVSVAQETHAHMGIIAVPNEAAQEIANVLVLAGIRAIWNFAPVRINVPPNIVVETTDLAAGLAVLSRKLADALNPRR